MCLSTQLELSKVFKSKGLVFAQFWSKFKNSTSGWSPAVKIFREKYFCRIFVENMVPVAKKPEILHTVKLRHAEKKTSK